MPSQCRAEKRRMGLNDLLGVLSDSYLQRVQSPCYVRNPTLGKGALGFLRAGSEREQAVASSIPLICVEITRAKGLGFL